MSENSGFRLSDRSFLEVMQHPKVRAALKQEAGRRQDRAEAIANSEGVELDSEVSEGTRPKGRPYARVSSPNVAQEYGDSVVERKRVLGRAAEA